MKSDSTVPRQHLIKIDFITEGLKHAQNPGYLIALIKQQSLVNRKREDVFILPFF